MSAGLSMLSGIFIKNCVESLWGFGSSSLNELEKLTDGGFDDSQSKA